MGRFHPHVCLVAHACALCGCAVLHSYTACVYVGGGGHWRCASRSSACMCHLGVWVLAEPPYSVEVLSCAWVRLEDC